MFCLSVRSHVNVQTFCFSVCLVYLPNVFVDTSCQPGTDRDLLFRCSDSGERNVLCDASVMCSTRTDGLY